MAEVEESPAQRAARLRREKREKKIVDGGADRLAKITNISGRQQDLQPQLSRSISNNDDSLDPPEIDISNTPPTFNSASSPSTLSPDPQAHPFAALMQQAQAQQQQGQPGGPDANDPMMQLLQQMFSPPPGGTSSSIPGAAGTPGGPPGGLPPGLASMLGTGGGNPFGAPGQQAQAQAPSKSSYTWRILHAIFSLLLGAYVAFVLPFDGSREERESPMAVPVSIFWIFATVELGLQSARYMLEKGGSEMGGMFGTVVRFLPEPYGGYIRLASRYSGYYTTLAQDAMGIVFVLGAVAWWKGKVDT